MPTLPSLGPHVSYPVALREAGSRAARHSSCSRTNRRCRLPQNLASVLECNEGKIRRGRRAGVLLAPHTHVFSQPARNIPEMAIWIAWGSLWAASLAASPRRASRSCSAGPGSSLHASER